MGRGKGVDAGEESLGNRGEHSGQKREADVFEKGRTR